MDEADGVEGWLPSSNPRMGIERAGQEKWMVDIILPGTCSDDYKIQSPLLTPLLTSGISSRPVPTSDSKPAH